MRNSIAEATKTLVEQEQTYQTSKQALEELRAQYEATGSSNEYLAQQIANGEADLRKQQETMNATKGPLSHIATRWMVLRKALRHLLEQVKHGLMLWANLASHLNLWADILTR
jgi:chromosome segregation ATPase